MLGPLGSELMNIFRLLSPGEIDRYTELTKSSRVEGVMTAGGETLLLDEALPQDQELSKKQDDEEQAEGAEVISLDQFRKDDDREAEANILEHKNELSDIGALTSKNINKKEDHNSESSEADSATVFLLKEREKLRTSKKKLFEQDAYKSYKENSDRELTQESDDEMLEEDGQYGSKGILINKKHY